MLGAVVDVLADRGYEGTRFVDVAAAGGVAISTLQTYFGSREDMVIEAMAHATDLEVAELDAIAQVHRDPWRRLVAMIDRSLDSTPATRRLLVEFWRGAMRDDELREHGANVLARYRAPFLAAVLDGREQGTVTAEHPPEDVVDLVLTALAGVIVLDGRQGSGVRAILLAQLRATPG